MSTVAEITEALAKLNNDELHQVEAALVRTFRERKVGILFDDTYGVVTEDDMAQLHDEMFAELDAPKRKK